MKTTFVLFGITGDLAKKKVLPAFFSLYKRNLLDPEFSLIGYGRSALSHKELHAHIAESLAEKGTVKEIKSFLSHCSYVSGNYDTPEGFETLKSIINNEKCFFYVSLPPFTYESVITSLGTTGLIKKSDKENRVILLEKPFGMDLADAKKLASVLEKYATEQQIYRIDHYLGKNSLRDLHILKQDPLFREVLEEKHIRKVTCTFFETLTVEDRASFYDSTGALKDVGQNHMLQMLAALFVREVDDDKKALAERQLFFNNTLLTLNIKQAVRAQYKDYKNHKGVEKNTHRDTFFYIKLKSTPNKNKQLEIIFQGGKAMAENNVSLEVEYEKSERETYSLIVNFSKETLRLHSDNVSSEIICKKAEESFDEAYEKIIFSAIQGEKSSFASMKEIEASWTFIEHVEHALEKTPLIIYKKGSTVEQIIDASA